MPSGRVCSSIFFVLYVTFFMTLPALPGFFVIGNAFAVVEDSDHIQITAIINNNFNGAQVDRGQTDPITDLPVDFTIRTNNSTDITATCRLVFIGGEENADESAGTVVADTENVCLNNQHEKTITYDENVFTATKDGKYRFEVETNEFTASETADFLFRISGFGFSAGISAGPVETTSAFSDPNPPWTSCETMTEDTTPADRANLVGNEGQSNWNHGTCKIR